MDRAVRAGFAYFLSVFALGFVLGTVRTLVLEPRVSLELATLVELPVMLLAAWFLCGWAVLRFRVPRARSARVLMGAVAFALLMAGELAVSVLLMGGTVADHLATYGNGAKQLGLAAQIAFALFPAVRR